MKKIAIIGLIGLWACGGGTDLSTPEATVKGFFEAMNKADFETAKKYVTKQSYAMLRQLEADYNMSSEEERLARRNNTSKVNCAEKNGEMICNVCCTAVGTPAELFLIQDNKHWLVQLGF